MVRKTCAMAAAMMTVVAATTTSAVTIAVLTSAGLITAMTAAMIAVAQAPDHNWQRGYRVPPQYRSHHYVVNDWRGHHLSAPPRGYQWVQNGADYLLIGIATGVIANMVLGGY